MINIQQVSETTNFDILQISGIQINPSSIGENYAQGLVFLKSSTDSEAQKRFHLSFTKEELDQWGEDDSFIINLIATKLGFNLE
jgi:hypothetical protein